MKACVESRWQLEIDSVADVIQIIGNRSRRFGHVTKKDNAGGMKACWGLQRVRL